jgi:hypothetical protein
MPLKRSESNILTIKEPEAGGPFVRPFPVRFLLDYRFGLPILREKAKDLSAWAV